MEISKAHKYITDAYVDICKISTQYGTFHKCLFHLHTPASSDYAVLEKYRHPEGGKGKTVKDFSDDEICRLCIKYKIIQSNIEIEGIKSIIEKVLDENNKIFNDIKELVIFLLIAWQLIKNNIELVVISDHNTINGFDKLNKALGIIHKQFNSDNKYRCPILLLGVEISCADKNHVVGIFQPTEAYKIKVNEFLKEYLINQDNGTYLTSLDIINNISKLGGIPYIAHINSSDMFKAGGNSFSGAYKHTLFNDPNFSIVGINDIESKPKEESILRIETKKEFAFVIDNDSHSLETINDKFFWIKGQKCNFNMIKEAFRDYDICIKFEKPQEPYCYIKGILARHNDSAFLAGNPGKDQCDFVLTFSESLNCFIGGRGTGKSTIINMIEVAFRQHFATEEIFETICAYPDIWVLFSMRGKDYLLWFTPPAKEYNSSRLLDVWKNYMISENKRTFYSDYSFDQIKNDLSEFALKKYIKLLKISSVDENGIEYTEVSGSDKEKLLDSFFHRSYSINEMIQTAQQSEKINKYIIDIMKINSVFHNIGKGNFKSKQDLLEFLLNLNKTMKKHNDKIILNINKFNLARTQQGKLKIVQHKNTKVAEFINFEKMLKYNRNCSIVNGKKFWKIRGVVYNFTIDLSIEYLYKCCKDISISEFFIFVLQKEYDKIYHLCSVKDFCEEYNEQLINNDVIEITDQNGVDVISDVLRLSFVDHWPEIIYKFKNNFIDYVNTYSLEFNVLNREGVQGKREDFKDIKKLSLGQKVVAMLSFVLGYSDYSKDYSPLVIDQPEDSLDSQYIYKNLVDDLRNVKTKRQVIIATHNATIVTNAKADQVVVLESNGSHGWIQEAGYPNKNSIKRHIINYLEGGIDSFNHKRLIYEEILKGNMH